MREEEPIWVKGGGRGGDRYLGNARIDPATFSVVLATTTKTPEMLQNDQKLPKIGQKIKTKNN